MNDAAAAPTGSLTIDAILDAGCQVYELTGSSREQFRRYAGDFLRWCEAEGIRSTDPRARPRYRGALEGIGRIVSERQWKLRSVSLNKVPVALAEARRLQRLASAGRRTRLVDAVPEGSLLSRAMEAALRDATGTYRRGLRCELAVVLEWCANHGIDPERLSLPDLRGFDEWMRATGRRSRSQRATARRLAQALAALRDVEAWWR